MDFDWKRWAWPICGALAGGAVLGMLGFWAGLAGLPAGAWLGEMARKWAAQNWSGK